MNDQDKDKLIAALSNEIDMLKSVIYKLPGHVYWQDIHGKYLGCNNNVAKLLKLNSPEEIIGKTNAELMEREVAENLADIDVDVLQNKKEVRIEEAGFDADDQPALYLTQKSPLLDDKGEIQGLLGVSLNITARAQIEERLRMAKRKAEAASRAKSQFLALISHELRTPLTSILGFVSFLQRGETSEEERKQYIQYITNSGSYLFSLINNILDYNKLDTKKYAVNNQPLNLKLLMEDVISMLMGSAKLKNISLSLIYPKNVPEDILSDNDILRKILVNLIGNAIKFTEKGSVTLTVKCMKQNSHSTQLQISVEDTGIGIAPEDLRSIFKRFHQLSNVYTRNTSLTGTGLGLAIVKKFVKLLGSKIEVTSTLNVGSKFYFNADFPLPVITKSLEQSSQIDKKIRFSRKPRVLMVEDDALIQIVHNQMFEDLECQVSIAENAGSALEMLQHDYDILFVDIGLPDMNGFDLIKTIKGRYLKESRIPIIALTGYSEEEEYRLCIEAGADEVAIKPISTEGLGKILERYLDI